MTDYGQLAANLLQKNFSKFGSFRTLCSFSSVRNSSYSPTTGNSTPVIDSTQTGVWIIFADFTYTQITSSQNSVEDEPILEEDQNAIVPSLDLNVKPKKGDLITDSSGVVWTVVGLGKDPKPAVYQLHVRPNKNV